MKTIYTLFFILISLTCFKAATFTSINTGTFSVASMWSVTGVDADGIPDVDDDVTINAGHTARLSGTVSNKCRNLTINVGGILDGNFGKKLNLVGNFTNNGNVFGNISFVLSGAGLVFSSTNPITTTGNIWVNATCSIAAGTVINLTGPIYLQYNNTRVNNFGSVRLIGATGQLRMNSHTNSKWINENNSSLSVEKNILTNGSSVLTFTTVSNTVTYAGTATSIAPVSYNNLAITAATTKSLTAPLVVTGNFTLSGTTSNILVPNGNKITLSGNFVSSARVNSFAGDTLVFEGAATQTVTGTINNIFYDVKIRKSLTSASVVFNAPLRVRNDLFVIKGVCNSNDNLTLYANSTTTGRLAVITNTADVSFTGNLVVQKYLPAKSYKGTLKYAPFYHDLSSPVSNGTVNDWDNELYISGIGTYDGIGGPAGVDGWDYNNTPSMHTYNTATNAFVAVTGSSTALTPGKGYNLLLLDQYVEAKDSGEFYTKTIDTRGLPNYGRITFPLVRGTVSTGAGWNLVGNPYASPIQFSASTPSLSASSFSTTFIYYDSCSNYVARPRLTTVIPAHQGFYIIRNLGAPVNANLVFTEACKVSNYSSALHFRQAPNFGIKLLLSSASNEFFHENEITFNDQATVNFDEDFDAVYKQHPRREAPAIFMIDQNGAESTINSINDEADEVTIALGIFTPKAGMYAINTSVLNKASYTYAWIENIKTGQKYDANKAVMVQGEELSINKDYVLKLSKKQQQAELQVLKENSLLIFSTENTINLRSTEDNIINELMIYDMTGKLMLSQSHVILKAGEISKIDVTNFQSGIYIVQSVDKNGKVVSRKLIK
jgi:hypothetical protein